MNESHKRRSVFWYILGVPFGLVLLLLLVMFGRESAEKRRLQARLTQLKSQGVPTDNQSMTADYESKTNKADAAAWNSVFAQLQSDEFQLPRNDLVASGVDFYDPKMPNSAKSKELSAARDFLLKFSRLYTEISDCARYHPNPRFITQFDSAMTLLPHCGWIRHSSGLLMLHGLDAIQREDGATVVADYKSILGCAEALRSGPCAVEQLVACKIRNRALELFKLAIERDLISDSHLVELLPDLISHGKIDPGWRQGLQGEVGGFLPVFTDIEIRHRQAENWTACLPFRSADANLYVEFMDRAIAIPIDDIDRMNSELAKLDADLVSLTTKNWAMKFDSTLTKEYSVRFVRLGESFIRIATQYRMTAVAVAIRLHEHKHGTLPTTLDDLTEFGVDANQLRPLGGKPFGYDASKPIALWDPNDSTLKDTSAISSSELVEYLNNRGPTQWQFKQAEAAKK